MKTKPKIDNYFPFIQAKSGKFLQCSCFKWNVLSLSAENVVAGAAAWSSIICCCSIYSPLYYSCSSENALTDTYCTSMLPVTLNPIRKYNMKTKAIAKPIDNYTSRGNVLLAPVNLLCGCKMTWDRYPCSDRHRISILLPASSRIVGIH